LLVKPKKRKKGKQYQTLWCDFSKKESDAIDLRDGFGCIIPNCNESFGLSHAHVFKPRSKGGVGNRINGVLLCGNHHNLLDDKGALGTQKEYEQVKEYCESYLYDHYGEIDIDKLIYNKWR
jgi:hypothetical protein